MLERKSIALQYNELLPAPFVVAKGKGDLASKLAALAEAYDIDVVEEEVLAEALFCLDVGEFIPEPFYRAVAEILAHVIFVSSGQRVPTGGGR